MAKPTLFICDIDGVLCDSRKRMKSKLDWKAEKNGDHNAFIESMFEYNKTTKGDKIIPKGVQLYWAIMTLFKPDRRIFLTGRNNDGRKLTLEWMREHVDGSLEDEDVIMESTPVKNNGKYWYPGEPSRHHSIEYKRDWIIKLSKKYDIILSIDDEDRNCKMYEEEGVTYLQFKDPEIDMDILKDKMKGE